MIKYLISKSATNKIRVAIISHDDERNEDVKGFNIYRETYQLGGKHTQQPTICIQKGLAKRTVWEQTLLRYNKEVKEKLDKGYKELDKAPEEYTEDELYTIVGEVKTDANGFSKHMLAKQSDKVSDNTINKLPYWYISRKLDGVRCGIYWDGEKIRTASRGGGDYDCAMMQFIEHPKLIEFFKQFPNWTLDGEIYKHGWSLMQLSGEARRCEHMEGSDDLEFWVYDIMIPGIPFEERLGILNVVEQELCSQPFTNYPEWVEGDLRIQVLPQEKVTGRNAIDSKHDEYVSEGFEGAVFRDPSKEYGFGKRDNRMLKVKKFTDEEFEIVGIQEGLREEDMCFRLLTEEGKEFLAKPMGSRELKQEYRKNIDNIVGKLMTVKYFYRSPDDNIPQLPVAKCIRDYEG